MKKLLYVFVGVALTLGVLGIAGVVYAQTQNPPENPDFLCPFCEVDGTGLWHRGGMHGGRGGFGPGMMAGELDGEYGPMHEAMSAAVAEAFGLTENELDALHESSTTLWEYAEEQGMTQEEFAARMLEVRTSAVNQAVSEGVLTQEQADWMLERMDRMQGGECDMESGFGFGRRGAHRGAW